MERRTFLKLSAMIPLLSSCGLLRIDTMHPMIRSDVILSPEDEARILAKARLTWTEDKKIRVLITRGTPYERGYQHGKLLRKEVQDNLLFLYRKALLKFRSDELFAEVYERMRPFIPQDYIDEMHGLAHGAKIPLHVIHHIHVLADMGEWGGKKRLGKLLKDMMSGDLMTMCSNIAIEPEASDRGQFIVVRILDWGLHKISHLHKYPLINIEVPEEGGIVSANIGWVGYLGAVSGMNAEGITLGEMGYRDPPGEVLEGIPMPFLLREVMKKSHNLADVRKVVGESIGTNSYVFLMSDGKTKESELYIKDRKRFLTFKPGEHLHDDKEDLTPIPWISYGGRYNDRLTESLKKEHGKITTKLFMDKLIPHFAMPSNFQNVIYLPDRLQFFVANAKSKSEWAASQPYTFVDLGKILKEAK
jgi:isopenicillin-N N-acyltransferase like protein